MKSYYLVLILFLLLIGCSSDSPTENNAETVDITYVAEGDTDYAYLYLLNNDGEIDSYYITDDMYPFERTYSIEPDRTMRIDMVRLCYNTGCKVTIYVNGEEWDTDTGSDRATLTGIVGDPP